MNNSQINIEGKDKDGILKDVFGYSNFRHGQDAIIDSIVDKKEDNLVIIPTGGGKSLIYQISGMLLSERNNGGVTLVISPLISLMKDQVKELRQRGIPGIELSSHNKDRDNELQSLIANQKGFLFVSPEKLSMDSFRESVKDLKINLIVIDEAHCVSLWGHQFRPEYAEIGDFVKQYNIPVVGLTATANTNTIEDIKKSVFRDPKSVNTSIGGYFRENFNIKSREKKSDDDIMNLISDKIAKGENGIVYFSTIKSLDAFVKSESNKEFRSLVMDGLAGVYHGKSNQGDRVDVQEKFINGEIKILLATTAFGMGVNKPDIDYIVHAAYPGSVESYYQEIGRGGRDGRPVEATIFRESLDTQLFFIESSYLTGEQLRAVVTYLDSYTERFRVGNTWADSFKIKDFKALSENVFGNAMYNLAIYSHLIKNGIIKKNDFGELIVNIKNLKSVLKSSDQKIFKEASKIKESKRRQVYEMNAFFDPFSSFSIGNMNSIYKDDNFINDIEKSTYFNILKFFGDEKGMIELKNKKSIPIVLEDVSSSDLNYLEGTLSSLGRKDIVSYIREERKKFKSKRFSFFDDIILDDDNEETTKNNLKNDKKSIKSNSRDNFSLF